MAAEKTVAYTSFTGSLRSARVRRFLGKADDRCVCAIPDPDRVAARDRLRRDLRRQRPHDLLDRRREHAIDARDEVGASPALGHDPEVLRRLEYVRVAEARRKRVEERVALPAALLLLAIVLIARSATRGRDKERGAEPAMDPRLDGGTARVGSPLSRDATAAEVAPPSPPPADAGAAPQKQAAAAERAPRTVAPAPSPDVVRGEPNGSQARLDAGLEAATDVDAGSAAGIEMDTTLGDEPKPQPAIVPKPPEQHVRRHPPASKPSSSSTKKPNADKYQVFDPFPKQPASR